MAPMVCEWDDGDDGEKKEWLENLYLIGNTPAAKYMQGIQAGPP